MPNLGEDETWDRSAKEWWEQCVFVLGPGKMVRRKDIVLVAANKDGGAHIDPKLTPEYERLAQDGGLVRYRTTDENQVHPPQEMHFVALRTMGWELLNSSELVALASDPASG